jgi:hypothetical protein
MPTPGGVPVVIRSPGSSVMNSLMYETSLLIGKIMVLDEPSCLRTPLTSSHMARSCGSPTSSEVTIQGPTGPKVSQPLPLSQVPPRSIWKARSETSLIST